MLMPAPAPRSTARVRMARDAKRAQAKRRSEAAAPAVEPGIAVVSPLTGVFYSRPRLLRTVY